MHISILVISLLITSSSRDRRDQCRPETQEIKSKIQERMSESHQNPFFQKIKMYVCVSRGQQQACDSLIRSKFETNVVDVLFKMHVGVARQA